MSVTIRERNLQTGKWLYLDVYHQGRRRVLALGLKLTGEKAHDKDQWRAATALRDKVALEIFEDRFSFDRKVVEKVNLLDYFDRVASEFLSKENENRNYRSTTRKLREYAGDTLFAYRVDKKFCIGFRDYLDNELSRETARIYFTIFKAVLNKAVDEDLIETNPAQRVKNLKKEEPFIEYLSEEDLKVLMVTQCRKPRVKDAFLFSCYTGLRYSDARTLRWKDIRNNRLTIRMRKSRSEPLTIDLHPNALAFAGNRGGEETKVFDIPDQATCWTVLKEWSELAGIKRVHYHMSRHTFVTLLINAGVDIVTVSKLAGHKDIKTTMRYVNILDATKKKAIQSLPRL